MSETEHNAQKGSPSTIAAVRSRVTLLDIQVDLIDRLTLLRHIRHACLQRLSLQIATISVHFMTLARCNHRFRDVINHSDISLADGRLVLWATWISGRPAPEQISGHDLFRDAVALAQRFGFRIYLLGGRPRVVQELLQRLQRDFPGLAVDGTDGGTFSDDGRNPKNEDLLNRISAFDPQLIFVALGAPKQELWIADNLARLRGCVAIGVGGVFDTQAGYLPRAPRWMQVVGLESAFQLLIAPRRYARRFLIEDPPTFGRMVAHAFRQRFS
jgi:N-acetylglucosaminyldiphosphoundecaprenol N-acetyl-beta-D-mannosaminyltransferase